MHPSPGTWLDRRGRERAAGPHGPRKRRAAACALALAATVAGLAACSDEPSATPAANNTAATTTIARPCDDDGVVALLGWDRAELRNQPEVVAVSAGGEARSVSGDWVAPDGAMAADGTVVLVRADGDYESAGPETETLWVRPADGSEPRRLTGGPNDTAPAISPDGEDVAFVQLEWNADALRHRVARVPIDGGEVVGATPWQDDARVVDVAWSPDGERLAYLLYEDGRFRLRIHEAGSEGARDVPLGTERPIASSSSLLWTPDGERDQDDGDGAELTTQIGHRAFLDGSGDLLHRLGALVGPEHPAGEDHTHHQGEHRKQECRRSNGSGATSGPRWSVAG